MKFGLNFKTPLTKDHSEIGRKRFPNKTLNISKVHYHELELRDMKLITCARIYIWRDKKNSIDKIIGHVRCYNDNHFHKNIYRGYLPL